MKINKNEEIVIYGAGHEGEKFYYAYGEQYRIRFYIDRMADRSIHGIPVYSLNEKKEELKKYKVVVASSETVYNEIKDNLLKIGLIENKDFDYCAAINKDKLYLYGNCHMRIINDCFQQNTEFNKRFYLKFFSAMDGGILIDEIKYCDLLIAQHIRKENELCIISTDELLEECLERGIKTVIIPNLFGFRFLFPQIIGKWKNVNKLHQLYYLDDDFIVKGPMQWMIAWQDEYIEKMLDEGHTVEEIVNRIEQCEIYDENVIMQNFLSELERLKNRELKTDIVISDFIEDKFREIPLFYDPGHPTNTLLIELAKRILCKLDIEWEEPCVGLQLDCMQIFIYPCVIKALKIQYSNEIIRVQDFRGTLWNRPINLCEYVFQYKKWIEG